MTIEGVGGVGQTQQIGNQPGEVDNTTNNDTQVETNGFIKGTDDAQQEMQADVGDLNDELKDLENGGGEDKGMTPAEVQKRMAEIQKQIKELNDEIDDLKNKRETALNEKGKQEELLKEEKANYNRIKERISDDQSELKKLIKKIEDESQDMEDEAQRAQRRAVFNAMASYNKEEDGDWDKYLEGQLKGVGTPDASVVGWIRAMSGSAENLSSEIKGFMRDLSGSMEKIDTYQKNITGLTSEINDYTTKIETDGKTIQNLNNEFTQLIPKMVSKAEWDLVEKNNINIYEKIQPGNKPRYIFAPGKQDGQYHIYDMGNDGASLARQFGKEGGLRGSDIVPSGNGYIRDFSEIEGECPTEGETIYYMDDCCTMQSKQACYTTCSPLSLDLDCDRDISTVAKEIEYDIDGDGKKDIINDTNGAVLVFDKDGDGKAGENGSECFGDNTDLDGDGKKDGYANGFEALAALARQEGLINDADDMTLDKDDLIYLQEKMGFGLKVNGYNDEVSNFFNYNEETQQYELNEEVGVTEIKISTGATNTTRDDYGNDIQHQDGAVFVKNGKEWEYADVWHNNPKQVGEEGSKATTEFEEGKLLAMPEFEELDISDITNNSLDRDLEEANSKAIRTRNKLTR